ncbi:MAG: hypothetical protein ACXVHL_37935, partial [Solirubrobacteraceae bacterium]
MDEADRVKTVGLELLRDHYDRAGVGLVLIGMPGLHRRLARYPQLYSRVGFAHEYRPLSHAELSFVLAHHWKTIGLGLTVDDFTDEEALAAVGRITGGKLSAGATTIRPDRPNPRDQRSAHHHPRG